MTVEKEYYELLQAYALGCLDKPDLDKIKNYIDAGGEYPWKELGEFQNLAALFPSILNMEIPSPQLKDKVARKLYRIKSDKPEKKTFTRPVIEKPAVPRPETAAHPPKKDEGLSDLFDQNRITVESNFYYDEEAAPSKEFEKLEERETEEERHPKVQEFEIVTARTKEEPPAPDEEQILPEPPAAGETEGLRLTDASLQGDLSGLEIEENPVEEQVLTPKPAPPPRVTLKEKQPYSPYRSRELEPEKRGKGGIILASVLFVIVAAGLIFVYLKISTDVNVYKTSVDKLNQQIKALSSQVNNNQDLQKLLLTKNVKIVNLIGTPANQMGYGKLIISFDNSKGYLQLSDVPALQTDNAYQLWINIKGTYSSLGLFKPSENVEYFPFAIPELTNTGATKFLVSEEPSAGSDRPSGKIVLTGSLQ